MEIIKVENLNFKYPQKQALSDISFEIQEGEFITVCGKSGCGKTTLLRLLKPIIAPHGETEGTIYFEGKTIHSFSLEEQCRKIGFVMQNTDAQIVTDTVWHELAFGLENLSVPSSEIRQRVSEMATFFGLENRLNQNTSTLSGGQKQLLNLASVMLMQPSVVILDEPTSQLDPIASSEFLQMLSKINRELGTTVIISEHSTDEVFPMSDRVMLMDGGKIVAYDNPQNFKDIQNKNVYNFLPTPMRIYLSAPRGDCPITVRDGRKWLEEAERIREIKACEGYKSKREPSISVKNVYFRYEKNSEDIIRGLTFTVNKGELYAILGGNGTGKTTALSLMNSQNKPYRGNIRAYGKISTLPQNPQTLFTGSTVIFELEEMNASKEMVDKVVSLCELGELLNRHPYDLSGGEQQRAALAKVLLTSPDILLLDEPSKGLDVCFKQKLAAILQRLKSDGMTIIMVSHDVEFCARYADRCAMFFDGTIVGEDTPREFFCKKNFYTTAAARMSKNIIPYAVIDEDIIYAIGGEERVREREEQTEISFIRQEEFKGKTAKKQNIIRGIAFLILFTVFEIIFAQKYTDYKNYIVQAVGFILFGSALYNLIPKSESTMQKYVKRKNTLTKRTLLSTVLILICIPITIFMGMYIFDDKKYYFISLLVIIESMLGFILAFEDKKPKTSEIVISSTLVAICVAGRCAFYMLPQFKPVLALVIITGVCFGAQSGFLVGALCAFLSNFMLGQGPWTPWQMLVTGIVGFLAGILFNKGILLRTKLMLCIFGGISAVLVYGVIMNFASVLMFQTNPTWEMIIISCLQGIPMDIIHGVSTVFFLWFLFEPMCEKLERIKIKYGLSD